jgi:hypothetical protein
MVLDALTDWTNAHVGGLLLVLLILVIALYVWVIVITGVFGAREKMTADWYHSTGASGGARLRMRSELTHSGHYDARGPRHGDPGQLDPWQQASKQHFTGGRPGPEFSGYDETSAQHNMMVAQSRLPEEGAVATRDYSASYYADASKAPKHQAGELSSKDMKNPLGEDHLMAQLHGATPHQ